MCPSSCLARSVFLPAFLLRVCTLRLCRSKKWSLHIACKTKVQWRIYNAAYIPVWCCSAASVVCPGKSNKTRNNVNPGPHPFHFWVTAFYEQLIPKSFNSFCSTVPTKCTAVGCLDTCARTATSFHVFPKSLKLWKPWVITVRWKDAIHQRVRCFAGRNLNMMTSCTYGFPSSNYHWKWKEC